MGSIIIVVIVLIAFLLLVVGPVDIPLNQIFNILGGGEGEKTYFSTIILETRLPMALAAISCGVTLSLAGLLMQTAFSNPLAGPSVLGVSSGASFGVAVFMLGALGGLYNSVENLYILPFIGALCGGLLTIGVLVGFSSTLKNNVMLLIVGIMISYLCNAGISLLNYFSPAEGIKSYLIWGLGSYSGLRLNESMVFLFISVLLSFGTVLLIKPLNALLTGDRYAESLGYSIKKTRGFILLVSGLLVAFPTAFCGPIGFLGLVVPHIARIILKTSNHTTLIPFTILFGALISLLCALIEVLPADKYGMLPINIVTPFIGIPVILYILVKKKSLRYFQ